MTMTIYTARDGAQCVFYTVLYTLLYSVQHCAWSATTAGPWSTFCANRIISCETFTALHPWQQAKWPLHQNSKPNPLLSQAYTVICQVPQPIHMCTVQASLMQLLGKNLSLKGQCHKIFCSGFFMNHLAPQLLKITLGFFWNFWKFSEIFASEGAPSVSMTPAVNFATGTAGVVDTGGKFSTGINDTGCKFDTLVANNGNNIRLLTP